MSATPPLVPGTYAERTFRALELAAEGPPLSVGRLARELRVDERTARRLLARLVRAQVLCRHAGRPPTFTPGPRLARLGARIT